MCGLAALVTNNGCHTSIEREVIEIACERMLLRGPDALGIWQGDGITLGHRRLAIIDLDARSHQPMVSACGRYVIVYNGEIYNFRELRAQRESAGDAFRTTSDTEVLLALFAAVGEAMLPQLRGMFALFIWDKVARRGFVARDPYGIKPIYYAQTSKGLLLGSQVKALLSTGQVSCEPDPAGQAGFWLTGSVPEPFTWYRDIRAVPAGHSMWVSEGKPEELKLWWDIGEDWRHAGGGTLSNESVAEQVAGALRDSVRAHLVSDVPVGVLLSGGIDSGTLVGLMCEAGVPNLQGITIAFAEFAGKHEDEVPDARRIAQFYDIAHHVRVVTREEFDQDLPAIMDAMDQPSIDGVNTWFASKAVAELGLKVVVSGAGGDELFHGYSSFRRLPRMVGLWRRLSRLPVVGPAGQWYCDFQARRTGNARWLTVPDWAGYLPTAWLLQRGLFAPSELPGLMGEELASSSPLGFDPVAWISRIGEPMPRDPGNALSLIESSTYLRNQLLRDGDWASMGHSVELRTPLVDAWLLRKLRPVLDAFSRFSDKQFLAQAPKRPLPEGIIARRKTGFGIPVQKWLAGSGQEVEGDAMSRGWAREIVKRMEPQRDRLTSY